MRGRRLRRVRGTGPRHWKWRPKRGWPSQVPANWPPLVGTIRDPALFLDGATPNRSSRKRAAPSREAGTVGSRLGSRKEGNRRANSLAPCGHPDIATAEALQGRNRPSEGTLNGGSSVATPGRRRGLRRGPAAASCSCASRRRFRPARVISWYFLRCSSEQKSASVSCLTNDTRLPQ